MSTSVSTSVQSGTSTAKKNRVIKNWVTISAAIIICLVLGLVIRTQGYVSGSEFAPSHFVQRTFSFYEIPLVHWQITPIRRQDNTPSVATFVKTTILKTLPNGPASNWHLVSLSRGLSGKTNADANLLLAQLMIGDGTNFYWRDWSQRNPNHAAILWPIIQRLAKRELYILMPMVFATADSGGKSPSEMQKIIDRQLAEEYVSLISDMREAKQSTVAATLLSEALVDYPNHPGLQRLAQNE
ncbi:hypothetical protein N9F76_00450 [bacterium]|nr:hypothetical protein [bacterium]